MFPYSCRLPARLRSLARLWPKILIGTSLIFTLITLIPRADAQALDFGSTNGIISGTALSFGDNRPVGQVPVSLKSHDAGIFRSILTDLEGNFELKGLPAGTYDLEINEVGYEPVRTKVQLNDSTSKIVLYLKAINPLQIHRGKNFVSVRDLKIPVKARDEYQKGLLSLEKNDLQRGVEHFTKAFNSYSGYYEAQYHMGVAQLRLGQKDEAMQAFQRALDLSEGQYARAEFGLGVILSERGSIKEAEAAVRRGLEIDDSSPEGYVLLGIVLVHQGRVDEAEKSAREGLLRNPNVAEAHLVLSDVYASRRAFSSQIAEMDAFLKMQPNGPQSDRIRQARELALTNLEKSNPQD